MGGNSAGLPATPADSNMTSDGDQDDKTTNVVADSYWAKYNIRVEKPQYTDEQYEQHLKIDDWSREETDYLMDLVYEFDLRWVIIADRYEYQPSGTPKDTEDSMTVAVEPRQRTQEDMKARYYDVAAKLMMLHNPLSSMSTSEFDTHEKMTKYDPVHEAKRKMYAEQLMHRTEEEKHEEEMLLKELSRIVTNQEKFFSERKALYERLEAPHSTSRDTYSTAMYQSSQGLTQLMQNLYTQSKSKDMEKREKRRSTAGGEASSDPPGQNGADRGQRHSVNGGVDNKRPYMSAGTGQRQLSTREQQKFGVSYPTNERLVGGVSFRHERITKAGVAKSGVQTTRIANALTELKIPPRLFMPTQEVVTEYERLIENIKTLLEVKKLSEKVEGEIRVWRAQREQQEARDRGEEVIEGETKVEEVDEEEEESTEKEDNKDGVKEDSDGDNEDNGDNDGESNADENDESTNVNTRNNVAELEVEAEEDDNQDEEEDDRNGNEDPREEEEEDEEEDEGQENDPAINVDETISRPDEDADMDGNDNERSSRRASTSNRASAAPTTRNEGNRKRSASIMSSVSNKSSKRQRKNM